MTIEVSVDEVAAVRAFNRFYTNVIGLVHGMYLDMPYPLTEARLPDRCCAFPTTGTATAMAALATRARATQARARRGCGCCW